MLRPTTLDGLAPVGDGPRDCVRIHRTVSDWVALVGYDEDGEVQIEVRIRRNRVDGRWQGWLLRWMRGWGRHAIRLVK